MCNAFYRLEDETEELEQLKETDLFATTTTTTTTVKPKYYPKISSTIWGGKSVLQPIN